MGTRGLVTCSTNLATHEQHVLHSVDWVLEFADDGCGCISDALTDDPVLWEDPFHQKLKRRRSSELIVQGEGLEATCSDLESIARRFEEGAISFHVGPSRSSELTMYQLQRPRCGMRTAWRARGLYTALQLECFSGQPSKWLYARYQRWQAAFTSHGFGGQVMLSFVGTSIEEALQPATRFLPTPVFLRRGYTCSLDPSMSAVHEGSLLLKRWTASLFQYEFVALELDMLKSRSLGDTMNAPPKGSGEASTCTTSSSLVTMDDRTLGSVAQNALVIAMLFLQRD